MGSPDPTLLLRLAQQVGEVVWYCVLASSPWSFFSSVPSVVNGQGPPHSRMYASIHPKTFRNGAAAVAVAPS